MSEKEYKVYTLKELRELVGLNQKELAWASGVSSVYISLIESGEKMLNEHTAKKISEVYVSLMYGVGIKNKIFSQLYEETMEDGCTLECSFEKEINDVTIDIMSNHLAGFYSEELQGLIVELMYKKQKIEEKLREIIETGKEPVEKEIGIEKELEGVSIYDKIKHVYYDRTRENAVKLKERYKNKPKIGLKI